MKNWALLLASVVVVASAVTLRAQQVDQGADMGGGGDAGAVDNGGADTGGFGAGGGGGGFNNGNQGGGGGRGGRGGRAAGGFGQQGQAGQGQQGGRQGRQQQGGQQLGQGQQLQLGGQQGGIQQFGQQQGGGQQYNPSARNLQMIQQALTSPDEEWAVLQPKVQALLDAQTLGSTNVRGLGGGFGGGAGGGGGRGGRGQQGGQGAQAGFGTQQAIDANANPVAAAQLDLETTLQDINASDELIRVKLKALRDAKAKVKTLLAKAQDDLREYLTLRQEAVLIQYGYME